jgi:hypothetical protein
MRHAGKDYDCFVPLEIAYLAERSISDSDRGGLKRIPVLLTIASSEDSTIAASQPAGRASGVAEAIGAPRSPRRCPAREEEEN